jgi:hypothetical protein
MKYGPTIDIWAMTEAERKAIHPGQWVKAGTALGRYLGQKQGGTDVVLWRAPKGQHLAKLRTLREYARATA